MMEEELRQENESLRADKRFLECLYAAGVDNWDGYDVALEMMEEESDD